MKTTTKKKFDCVKSVRKERDRIASDTEGMSARKVLDYYRERKMKKKTSKEKQEKTLIMKTITKKKFDCVKSVRKERERIASDTEGMSASEVLEYFRERKMKKQSSKEKP